MKIFHERLKEILAQKKVSQRGLAKKLNVTQQTVNGWANKDIPTLERLKEICETLDVSADFLLGLDKNQ